MKEFRSIFTHAPKEVSTKIKEMMMDDKIFGELDDLKLPRIYKSVNYQISRACTPLNQWQTDKMELKEQICRDMEENLKFVDISHVLTISSIIQPYMLFQWMK